jgi:methyl coenzyme M reductase subunit D
MRNPTMGTNSSNDHYAAIDREQLANIISQYSTDVPHVDDVSTLVTDEEVLIVYKTDSKNRSETADQVKRMAMSVVPRFYHVYVSDNTRLRKNIENFATLDSDSKKVDPMINGLIKQMKQSPQGRKMNNSENPNGEMQSEK